MDVRDPLADSYFVVYGAIWILFFKIFIVFRCLCFLCLCIHLVVALGVHEPVLGCVVLERVVAVFGVVEG